MLAVVALLSIGSDAFAPSSRSVHRIPKSLSASAVTEEEIDTDIEGANPTKKAKRLEFMKTPTFHRKGFKEVRENVEKNMGEQFKSDLVDELKSNN